MASTILPRSLFWLAAKASLMWTAEGVDVSMLARARPRDWRSVQSRLGPWSQDIGVWMMRKEHS
jgi:hypothetical protein